MNGNNRHAPHGHTCVDCGGPCTQYRTRCKACSAADLRNRYRQGGTPGEPTEAEVEATIAAQSACLPPWWDAEGTGAKRIAIESSGVEDRAPVPRRIVRFDRRHNGKITI